MPPLTPLLLKLAIAAALVLADFAFGYHVAAKHAANEKTALVAKHEAEQLQLQDLYQTASTSLETLRDENRKLELKNASTVERLVQRPAYSAVCLDADGVRVINSAITGRDDPAAPSDTVPASSPAQ